jgi:nucleotide-binding universal stress UspA family protein
MESDELAPDPSDPIICGLDGSEDGEGVARIGEHLALALGHPLLLLHVAPAPLVGARPAANFAERLAEAEAFERAGRLHTVLEPVAERLQSSPACAVEFGDPGELLAAAAEQISASLLVIGRSRQWMVERVMLGSTTAVLARRAPCPVAIVPAESPPLEGDTIVAGIDGSGRSIHVARVAALLAHRLGLRLVLAAVGPAAGEDAVEPALEAAAEVAADIPREGITADGSPAEVLAALGRSLSAQLLVVGSRGLGPIRAAVLGSTSSALVEHADRAVVVVPDLLDTAG